MNQINPARPIGTIHQNRNSHAAEEVSTGVAVGLGVALATGVLVGRRVAVDSGTRMGAVISGGVALAIGAVVGRGVELGLEVLFNTGAGAGVGAGMAVTSPFLRLNKKIPPRHSTRRDAKISQKNIVFGRAISGDGDPPWNTSPGRVLVRNERGAGASGSTGASWSSFSSPKILSSISDTPRSG
ncbi:MAG: hypothetical protein JO170_14050 [Verrucomicrobia bacterium]|nr:hypothetical protein [Verrucomicrobiota bacterium]